MNRFRSLLLTMLILLPASRLLGQGKPRDVELINTPVVCNDGTIPVSVARAFSVLNGPFYSDQWVIQGWYTVGPGTCDKIGPEQRYQDGGLFGQDVVTLLAFAFRDSTGVWGAARFRDTTDGVFKPSNQKLCVQDGEFRVVRDASKGEDPAARECGRGQLAGYYQIPASLVFKGDTYGAWYGDAIVSVHSRDYLHVSLGPNDRAIPSGTQGSSQTSSNASGNGSPKSSADDNSFGAALLRAMANALAAESNKKPAPQPGTAASAADDGKANLLKWVREDVNAYLAASATGFDAYKKGNPIVSPGYRSWVSSEAPVASKGCWVVEGDTAATFSCLLSTSTDLNALRHFYAQLIEDVTASLPGDWKPQTAPPYGPDFPESQGYRASSGAHGEIWIAHAASGEYELHYQLVTAEHAERPTANPAPLPAASDDDPIGGGGFIAPPTVRQ